MVITILPQSFGKGNKHFEKNCYFQQKEGGLLRIGGFCCNASFHRFDVRSRR